MSNNVLSLHLFHRELKFIIPILPETPDKRFFEITVNRNMLPLSLDPRRAAHIPTVEVQPPIITELLYSDGIEVAGNRLHETHLAITICLLNSTIATSGIIMAGKDTILAVDNLCDKLTFRVRIGNASLLYGLESIG